MINAIITAVFNFLIAIVLLLLKIILAPIDFLISQALPDISQGLTAIGTFLTTALTNIGWVISITGIPAVAIALIVAYWVFKLTLPINIWVIKLAVNWYHRLKP